jgi:hypothetical protein
MLREAGGGAAARVMTAVMGMGKLELAALEKAYEGGA